MIGILLSLVITIGFLYLGTYLLNKYGRINDDDFNLLYAGYFSIKAILKISELVSGTLLGVTSMQTIAGAALMLIIDGLFAYYFFKKANVL